MDRLNEAQLRVVQAPHDVPLLILAAAGTGKTETLTLRIAHLIRSGVPPEHILAVTFSNRAAREMRERATRHCNLSSSSALSVHTFHALCTRILRMSFVRFPCSHDFTILDEKDALGILEPIVQSLSKDKKGDKKGDRKGIKTKTVYGMLNPWRNACLINPSDVPYPKPVSSDVGNDEEVVAWRAFSQCREECQRVDGVDFADLLCYAVGACQNDETTLERLRAMWWHVLTDEYQDTNDTQFELVQMLEGGRGGISVVGDDSQTIHEHAGAKVRRILDFSAFFPGATTIPLELNYRSYEPILEAANALISHNEERADKVLVGTRGLGNNNKIVVEEYPSEEAEARGIVADIVKITNNDNVKYGDICILYRINALSEPFEAALKKARIPFRLAGGPCFFGRAEVKDAIAYIVAAVNPRSEPHVLRAMGSPPRGVGDVTVQHLKRAAKTVAGGDFLQAARHLLTSKQVKGRAAKGLEAFLDIMPRIEDRVDELNDLADEVVSLLERTGLVEHFRKRGEDECAENVVALMGYVRRTAGTNKTWSSLVETLALNDKEEEVDDGNEEGQVTLMSMHRSKGLEWPVVYLVGWAEGTIPY